MPHDPGLTLFLPFATLGSTYTIFKLFPFPGPFWLARCSPSKALCGSLCLLSCGMVSQVPGSFLPSVRLSPTHHVIRPLFPTSLTSLINTLSILSMPKHPVQQVPCSWCSALTSAPRSISHNFLPEQLLRQEELYKLSFTSNYCQSCYFSPGPSMI